MVIDGRMELDRLCASGVGYVSSRAESLPIETDKWKNWDRVSFSSV